MTVFSIDVPFKGSQSPSNMRSKVTAVSYLHSGVNDTDVHMPKRCQWLCCACHSGVNDSAVPCAVEPDFLIKKQCVKLFAKISKKKLAAQRCRWHRCACHSGVNDSAVHVTAVSMTPLCNQLCRLSSRIRSHIRKGFNLCIRDPGEVVWWKKKQTSKISCLVRPLCMRCHKLFENFILHAVSLIWHAYQKFTVYAKRRLLLYQEPDVLMKKISRIN
jgi:hypothetical protein